MKIPRTILLLLPWALFFLVWALYVLLLPGNRSEAEDSHWYARVARDGSETPVGLFHKHHLLYFHLIRGAAIAIDNIPVSLDPYDSLAIFHSLIGVASLSIFFLLLHQRLQLSYVTSLAAALGLGLSYGFWRYAVEIEIPVVGCFMSILLLYLSLSQDEGVRSGVLPGAVAGFSFLIHGLSLFVALVAIPCYYLSQKHFSKLTGYLAVAVVIISSMYGLAYYTTDGAVSYYTHEGSHHRHEVSDGEKVRDGFQWNLHTTIARTVRGFPKTFIALGHSVASGNFVWGSDELRDYLAVVFSDRDLADENVMAKYAPAWLFSWSSLTFLVLIGSSALLLYYRAVNSVVPSIPGQWYGFYWIIAIVSLLYLMLLTEWNAGNPELCTMVLPLLWTLVAAFVFEPLQAAGKALIVLWFVFALGSHNVVGGVLWIRDRESDYHWQKAKWLATETTGNDVVITADFAVTTYYIRYYAKAKVVSIAFSSRDELMKTVYRPDVSGRIYVLDDFFDPPHPSVCRMWKRCELLRTLASDIRGKTIVAFRRGHVTVYEYVPRGDGLVDRF